MRFQKIVAYTVFGLIFIACLVALAITILFQIVIGIFIAVVVAAFDAYFFYVRFMRHRRVRYPLVPPEGRRDWYLPTTNIPRPVIEDYRKIKEKKRRLAKVNRMMRRGKKETGKSS